MNSAQNNAENCQSLDLNPDDLAGYFSNFNDRLERMIEFRLDPRLRNRVDPADILQDAFLESQRRFADFQEACKKGSTFIWLRQITLQILIDVHRANFRQKRNVGQEVRLDRANPPGNATSLLMAHEIVAQISTPSRLVSREEEMEKLRVALDSMEKMDQEVLALRHFEQLTNHEVAEVLDISITAASNRYVRAMSRLAKIVNQMNAQK